MATTIESRETVRTPHETLFQKGTRLGRQVLDNIPGCRLWASTLSPNTWGDDLVEDAMPFGTEEFDEAILDLDNTDDDTDHAIANMDGDVYGQLMHQLGHIIARRIAIGRKLAKLAGRQNAGEDAEHLTVWCVFNSSAKSGFVDTRFVCLYEDKWLASTYVETINGCNSRRLRAYLRPVTVRLPPAMFQPSREIVDALTPI